MNMTNQETATFIVKSFVENRELKNCANCANWADTSHKCGKFGMTPPIAVILYGCGKDWLIDIPF